MALIVQKYVAPRSAIPNACKNVARKGGEVPGQGHRVVVVVSAMSGGPTA